MEAEPSDWYSLLRHARTVMAGRMLQHSPCSGDFGSGSQADRRTRSVTTRQQPQLVAAWTRRSDQVAGWNPDSKRT